MTKYDTKSPEFNALIAAYHALKNVQRTREEKALEASKRGKPRAERWYTDLASEARESAEIIRKMLR